MKFGRSINLKPGWTLLCGVLLFIGLFGSQWFLPQGGSPPGLSSSASALQLVSEEAKEAGLSGTDDWRGLFDGLDKNGDGSISRDEVPEKIWTVIQGSDGKSVEDETKDGLLQHPEFLIAIGPVDRGKFGVWSLIPALLALTLALITHQVLPALFMGIVSGSVVVFFHSFEFSDLNFLHKFFLPALGNKNFAFILLVYLWFLGGILGVWAKTGGPRYFADTIGSRLARGRRGSKFFAWIIGCVFHQGGTVSTVLAGTTVKPVSDKHGVSHEELSYIVDSTASPVATIIPFNAWPVFVAGLVAGAALDGGDNFQLIKNGEEGLSWFYRSIPFNFYAIFAVISTLLFSLDLLPWTGKRMRAAIQRSKETGQLDSETAVPLLQASDSDEQLAGYPTGLGDFLVPLGVLLGVAIVPMLFTGKLAIGEAFLACTLSAMALARAKGMPTREVLEGFLNGCKSMTLGAIILGMAVTLGAVSKELETADFLISVTRDWFPALLLPASLMLICMIVAFSIGSSWGTYAVVFPIAIPLALELVLREKGFESAVVANLATTHPAEWAEILFYVKVCFGAVMGGAVFGDQCSPISDTTILSSMFTGCDLMDHVRTQLPLALAAAFLGMICSTLCILIFA